MTDNQPRDKTPPDDTDSDSTGNSESESDSVEIDLNFDGVEIPGAITPSESGSVDESKTDDETTALVPVENIEPETSLDVVETKTETTSDDTDAALDLDFDGVEIEGADTPTTQDDADTDDKTPFDLDFNGVEIEGADASNSPPIEPPDDAASTTTEADDTESSRDVTASLFTSADAAETWGADTDSISDVAAESVPSDSSSNTDQTSTDNDSLPTEGVPATNDTPDSPPNIGRSRPTVSDAGNRGTKAQSNDSGSASATADATAHEDTSAESRHSGTAQASSNNTTSHTATRASATTHAATTMSGIPSSQTRLRGPSELLVSPFMWMLGLVKGIGTILVNIVTGIIRLIGFALEAFAVLLVFAYMANILMVFITPGLGVPADVTTFAGRMRYLGVLSLHIIPGTLAIFMISILIDVVLNDGDRYGNSSPKLQRL